MKHPLLHRVTFTLAGAYNVAWGTYSVLNPQWLFRYAHMPDANYPEVFGCLGMVLALYGFLYWYVAVRPARGVPIAAIGLIGKILGPIGLAVLIATRRWPPSTAILCITNDLIWWIPFGLYLRDSVGHSRTSQK